MQAVPIFNTYLLPGGRSCWGWPPWITRTDIGPETSCGCQLMMVVGIVILCWITMVVGSCSFNASHRRSTGLLLLWWWAVVVSMLHKKINFIIVTEDRLYYWKINCVIGRPIVVLEDRLYYWKIDYYWKINCDAGRSMVLLEDQLYWRQSTGLDGNYRSRKITARRWLHKYVGAECGASSFTWYLYQICNTDVRLSVCPSHLFYSVPIIVSSWNFQELLPMTEMTSMQKVKVRGQRSRSQVNTQLSRFWTVTPVWIHIW